MRKGTAYPQISPISLIPKASSDRSPVGCVRSRAGFWEGSGRVQGGSGAVALPSPFR